MKILVELNSPEELLRFFETMDPTKTVSAATPQSVTATVSAPAATPPSVPATVSAPAATPQKKPAQGNTISFEMVTQAAIKKMDAGKQTELRALLQKYGVQALPELKAQPEKLATFYADLEVL